MSDLPLFPVTTVGSWPRPDYLLRALRLRQRGRLSSEGFQATADRAVLEALRHQERAGIDVVTDGEQRRDNFYSFVTDKLGGVRLMTLAEMLELIEDKAAFERVLDTLDVPAYAVKNPTCVGRIFRKEPLALDDYQFLRRHTELPIKITLPGPYLLTRSMWVKETSGGSYGSKEELGDDVVGLLRQELRELKEAGVDFVQLDEPALSELVFTQGETITFMCAALAARKDPSEELEFAVDLVNRIAEGVDGIRLGLHVCRGNWSRNEAVLLEGSYGPLVPYLRRMHVGQLVLEYATPRAGAIAAVGESLSDRELGLGVVNPRTGEIESVPGIVARVEAALRYFPPERVFLNPDCGFGTFANRPLNTADVAEQKLRAMVEAARELRRRAGGSAGRSSDGASSAFEGAVTSMSADVTSEAPSLESTIAAAVEPHAVEVDRSGRFPRESVDGLAAVGLLGLTSAEEVGGQGRALRQAAEVVELVARSCGSTAMVMCMHYCATAVIEAYGSLAVREAIARNRHLSTLAFSEAGSRGHFWVPMSTASRSNSTVRLDARKSWVTSAGEADSYVWSSKPVAAEGLSTLWLVEAGRPGLAVRGPFDGLGLRGNASSPIDAENVTIPAAQMLGEDGNGFEIMMGVVLPNFQVLNAAFSIGTMHAAVARTAAHATTTRYEHLDQTLADQPTTRAAIARMQVRLDQARAHLLDTLDAMERGRSDVQLRVLEVKAAASEAALEVTDLAMRTCGGAAFRKEVGVERNFRDARAASVMAPSTDVLYDFIGKAVCGIPLF